MKYRIRYFEKGNSTVTWLGNRTFLSKEDAIEVAKSATIECFEKDTVDFTIIKIEESKDA